MDEVLQLDNRRRADRVAGEVTAQYCTESGATGSARTINVSSTGARMVVQDERLREGEFTLQLGSVQLLARQVWEAPLLRGKSRVVGVHFSSVRAAFGHPNMNSLKTTCKPSVNSSAPPTEGNNPRQKRSYFDNNIPGTLTNFHSHPLPG